MPIIIIMYIGQWHCVLQSVYHAIWIPIIIDFTFVQFYLYNYILSRCWEYIKLPQLRYKSITPPYRYP